MSHGIRPRPLSADRADTTAPSPSRRRFLAGAAGLAGAALVLSGCGEDGDGDRGGTGAGTDKQAGAGAEKGAFPVTVPGKPGPTTVKKAPSRVVAYGYARDTEIALALGAPLVLASRNANFPDGWAPWAKPGKSVTLVDTADGVPLEKLAAARPDLILAGDDYGLQADYARLSELAPTLGVKSGTGKDSWQVMTERTGQVLGLRDRADALVSQVQSKIDKAHSSHPEFKGKTFTFGPVTGGKIYTTSSAADASARFFAQLGMELAPQVTGLPASATPGRSEISPERLDLLDADVVILTFPNPKDRAKFEAAPLFKHLKAVKRGAYIAMDFPVAIALAFPSVLSIPYGLRSVVPQLSKALAAS